MPEVRINLPSLTINALLAVLLLGACSAPPSPIATETQLQATLTNTPLPSTGTTTSPPSSGITSTMIRPSDGMEMVYVPGGSFILSERGKVGERAHNVTLNNYWIDQTEITNMHYSQCVEDGVCQAPTACAWGDPTYEDDSYQDHPVICVTWQMANDYCEWAGGRLPTEAEWDYAARGPERRLYPWGDHFDAAMLNFCDSSCPHEDAQYPNYNDGYVKTSPVGSYPNGASWCGAMDMAGNVWEWVSDRYAPYEAIDQDNPQGPKTGSERLIRGGSWYDDAHFLRSDFRHQYNPEDFIHLIGFRCVVPGIDNEQ
jgi:formylglycine-generating enzyme required for sulfatase activity